MDRSQLYAGITILLIALGLYVGLSSISAEGGYSGLSPRFMPIIVATGLLLCSLGLIWQSVRGGFRNFEVDEVGQPLQWKSIIWLISGIVLHIVLIGKIGFVFSSTVMLVFVARSLGDKCYLKNSLIGIAITFPVWLLFTQALGLSLPLFPLLSSW